MTDAESAIRHLVEDKCRNCLTPKAEAEEPLYYDSDFYCKPFCAQVAAGYWEDSDAQGVDE